MSKKSIEIRCPNTLNKRGRDIKCGRFLVEVSDGEIRITCPKCGGLFSIIRDVSGKLRMQAIPKSSALISGKEKNHE